MLMCSAIQAIRHRHWTNASAAPTDAIHRRWSLKRIQCRSSEEPETLVHVFQEFSFWGGFLVALVPARSYSPTSQCHVGKEPVASWLIHLISLILYSRRVQAQLWLGLSWADFTQVSACSFFFFSEDVAYAIADPLGFWFNTAVQEYFIFYTFYCGNHP